MKTVYIIHHGSGLHEYLEFLLKGYADTIFVRSVKLLAEIPTKPDLVLLEMSAGSDLTANLIREFRVSYGDVPVLLVYPASSGITRAQALQMGADDLFPRLGNPDLLLEKIQYHLTINLLLERSFTRRKWVSESFGGIDRHRYSWNSRALMRKQDYYKTSLQQDSILCNGGT